VLSYRKRIAAVVEWQRLNRKITQSDLAEKFKISTRTLRRWIRSFRSLSNNWYRRPWNRFDREVEDVIVAQKEAQPWMNLEEAEKIFGITKRGIWSVWKRFGLAGYIKGKFSFCFLDYLSPGKEVSYGLEIAERLLKEGKVRYATRILNQLPICTSKEILLKFPDRLLNLRRRIEKTALSFEKIPLNALAIKCRKLRAEAEQQSLFILAARIGLVEAIALDRLGLYQQLLKLIRHLRKILRMDSDWMRSLDPSLQLSILLLEGSAYAGLMEIGKAKENLKICQKIVRTRFPESDMAMENLAALYTTVQMFKEARKWYQMVGTSPEVRFRLINMEALVGNYDRALKNLSSIEVVNNHFIMAQLLIIRALCYIGKGKPDIAKQNLLLSLEMAKGERLLNIIHTSTLLLASCYAALRKEKYARMLIRSYNPILRRLGNKRDLFLRYLIMGSPPTSLKTGNLTPPMELCLLIKKARQTLSINCYRRAKQYAFSKGIVSHFHIFLLFFPEVIRNLLKKGKNPGLSRSFLKLPIFRTESPVYHIKLLGPIRIYRNGKLIRRGLPPKGAALIIHLTLRGGSLPLQDLYANFWPGSKNPRRTLSHLLVFIRRNLRLTSAELYISSRFKKLVLKPVVTSDYQLFEETIIRSKGLLRAGEWKSAKAEFLRAIRLFRGLPLEKMFDQWSDELQRAILNKLRSEIKHFTSTASARGDYLTAKKLLGWLSIHKLC